MREVKPNVVVFNSAISACQKGNSEGHTLCTADLVQDCPCIYAFCLHAEAALALLETLDAASVEPDVVTSGAQESSPDDRQGGTVREGTPPYELFLP